MRTIHGAAAAALFLGLCGLAGCSGGPTIVPVEGTVKQGGKPLEKIQVEFLPDVPGPRSIGVTDESGRFVLKTDDGKQEGAVVGPHRVVLRDIGVFGDKVGRKTEGVDLAKGKKIRIPGPYSDLMSTPLKKEVAGGQKNQIDIDLK